MPCMKKHDLKLSKLRNVPTSTGDDESFLYEYVWVPSITTSCFLSTREYCFENYLQCSLLLVASTKPCFTLVSPDYASWLCTDLGANSLCSTSQPLQNETPSFTDSSRLQLRVGGLVSTKCSDPLALMIHVRWARNLPKPITKPRHKDVSCFCLKVIAYLLWVRHPHYAHFKHDSTFKLFVIAEYR